MEYLPDYLINGQPLVSSHHPSGQIAEANGGETSCVSGSSQEHPADLALGSPLRPWLRATPLPPRREIHPRSPSNLATTRVCCRSSLTSPMKPRLTKPPVRRLRRLAGSTY